MALLVCSSSFPSPSTSLPGVNCLDRPPALDVGVVAVSAALGGLVLNAGLNLKGSKRRETVQVAQKFIAVVILMIVFLPALHFVELMDGINLYSFQPDSLEAWLRGFFFWVGALSFYAGIGLFIVALVDLVFAMIGIDRIEHALGGSSRGLSPERSGRLRLNCSQSGPEARGHSD